VMDVDDNNELSVERSEAPNERPLKISRGENELYRGINR